MLRMATGFEELQCALGFRCLSKVSEFGLGHDGNFSKTPPQSLPARFSAETFEWGCPASGTVDTNGRCNEVAGNGATSCFSVERYDTDKCEDNCLCVRTSSSHPSDGGLKRADYVPAQGGEIQYGKYLVEPSRSCAVCAIYDKDRSACNECQTCRFGTKRVELEDPNVPGKTYYRRQQGCWTTPKHPNVEHEQLTFLGGKPEVQRDLIVVPHYKLWQPSRPGQRFAQGSLGEWLSRMKWVEGYLTEAPRMQKAMDIVAKKLVTEWVTVASDLKSATPKLTGCSSQEIKGDSLSAKLDQFLSIQEVCKASQKQAMELIPGSGVKKYFDPKACGTNFLDPEKGIARCGCYIGLDEHNNMCSELYCYTDDRKVEIAVDALRKRVKECDEEVALRLKPKPKLAEGALPSPALFAAAAVSDGGLLSGPVRQAAQEAQQPQQRRRRGSGGLGDFFGH